MDWSGTLQQRWWVDLLTLDGVLIRQFDGVTDMSADWKLGAAVRGTGQISVRADGGLDWRNRMARIWVETIDDSGEVDTSPLLTGMLEIGDEARTQYGASWPLKLLDRTVQLNAHLADVMVCPAGTPITQQIREWAVLLRLGQVAITESSTQASKDMVWQPGATWRKVFGDLCAAAGYGAIWADPMGTLQVHPYVAPGDRPVVETVQPGPDAIHVAEATTRTNALTVPNHLILIASQGADTEALVAARWDWDGPYGVTARGREVSQVLTVEAATRDVLEARADAEWSRLRSESRRTSMTWRWHPRQLMDRLTVVLEAPGSPSRTTDMTIQTMAVKAKAGQPISLVDVDLVEINSPDDAPTDGGI